ncbi:hypothetical protein UlMin_014375 [Ulmus minor]
MASLRQPLSVFRIYVSFCGRDPSSPNMSNWLECYDPSNNIWHRLTSVPGLIENHVLKGFSMVALGDRLYIIGGKFCHKMAAADESDEIEELDLEVRNSVLCYNVRQNTWSKCAPLKVPRFEFASTVADGKIYVAGGKSTLDGASGVSSAEVYDPVLDQWDPLPNMTTSRYKCVAVPWQGKIHVVGGFAGTEGSSIKERSSAEVYDSDRATWKLFVGMWKLDIPPNQIVAVGEKLFSSGDCLNAWKGHIEAYDGKLNIWDEVDGSHFSTLSSPVSTTSFGKETYDWPLMQRLFVTMAPIGTQLYFMAGYRKPGEVARSISVVHVFDSSEGSCDGGGWRSFEPLEEEGEKELCGHCCVGRI